MEDFVLGILENVIATIIVSSFLPPLLKYVTDHILLSAVLLWRVSQESRGLEDETETLIQFRNAGRVSIQNYPILVKFNVGAKIYETYCHIIPSEKNYNPLVEAEELRTRYRKQWSRAYKVNLVPKDTLQLHIRSCGNSSEAPTVSVISELLIQSQRTVLFARDYPQFFISRFYDAYPIFRKLVGNPGGGHWRILSLIVILTFGLYALQADWSRNLGGPVELGPFILGLGLAASIGFIVFYIGFWLAGSLAIFRARRASPRYRPSAAEVLYNLVASYSYILGVGIVALVTALEFEGRHDVVMQSLEFIFIKIGRFVNALGH